MLYDPRTAWYESGRAIRLEAICRRRDVFAPLILIAIGRDNVRPQLGRHLCDEVITMRCGFGVWPEMKCEDGDRYQIKNGDDDPQSLPPVQPQPHARSLVRRW